MKKNYAIRKQRAVVLCLIALAIGGLSFVRHQQTSAQTSRRQSPEVPAYVIYKHLFHHVMALKRKAEAIERNGKDASQFRTHFKRNANLSEEQTRALEDVAVEFDQEEQMIAARAKPLIAAYKAQYPNGQVPHGQTPAPPPEELKQLSEERDASVRRAVDRLHVQLGEEQFMRFDKFVRTRIASNVEVH